MARDVPFDVKDPFAQVAAWSAGHPVVATLLSLLLVGGLGAGMSQVEEGRISELFVPDDLPALDIQDEIQEIWGEEEASFFLYIVADPLDPDLARAIATDVAKLEALERTTGVESYVTILEARLGDLDQATDGELRQAIAQIEASPAGQSFLREDAVLVRILSEPIEDIPARTAALDAISQASQADADLRSAGIVYVEQFQQNNAGGDVAFLLPLSIGVVILFLAVLFRRPQDVIVPVVVSLLSIAMAYGTVAWLGLPLAPPSYIVMPLLLGLGVDYFLHILYAYREQDVRTTVPERFRRAGASVGYPVFYTATTTLIGFGSFLLSNTPQIRIWGLLIGSGALYAFLLGFLLLPALYRIRKPRGKQATLPFENVMDRVAGFILRKRGSVLLVVALVTVGLGTSAAFVDIVDEVAFELDEDAPPVRDFNEVQDRFGGQSLAQFLIEAGDREDLEAFEQDLLDAEGIGFVDGPIQRLIRAGTPDGPLVGPATEGVATEAHWLVTIGYLVEDSEETLQRAEAIAEASPLEAGITGQDVFRLETEQSFLPNLALSTLTALGLVILFLFVVFRRPGIAALAFLPLVITVVWQLGIQNLVGISINPITGVMTAMILGVGVDYSLHIMSHFQRDRKAGLSPLQAAEESLRSVGRPVLAASVTTVFAFSVLGFSSLVPLREFGIVAAIVVTCAFFVSLTLLPALASYLPAGKGAAASYRGGVRFRPAGSSPVLEVEEDYGGVRPRFSDPAVQAWFEERTRR